MESWDADGNHSVEEGQKRELPAKLLGDEAKLKKLAERLKKAKDEYKKQDILEKAAGDWSLRYPLLVHLAREGHTDLGADPDLWRFLADNDLLLGGEDVARLLRTAKVPKKWSSFLFEGWNQSLDELVMKVYARDPEPIAAAAAELKGKIKAGVALCRARFGEDVGKAIGDRSQDLAKQMVDEYGLDDRVHWFVDGEVQEVPLYRDGLRGEPTEWFGRLVELMTTVDDSRGSSRPWPAAPRSTRR